MRSILLLFLGLITALSPAWAAVSGGYFPADSEFSELTKITSKVSFEDPAVLSKVEDGRLMSDVGFHSYAKRVYSVGKSGSLSVEIVSLLDSHAAYSLLTLLRSGAIENGPPGDAFTRTSNGLLFAHGKEWVRIKGQQLPEDLARRVAMSINNRMGPPQLKPPGLVSRLPQKGLDPASLRYYPGSTVFEKNSRKYGAKPLRIESDAEIAQARYSLDNYSGTLFLLSFPTEPLAEDYVANLTTSGDLGSSADKKYTKRAGPIVGVLEGSFDPGTADKILSSVQYSYSVKWMYEKKPPKVLWGIPTGILGTVVKSLFFVVILFAVSILAGAGVALFRYMRRKRALNSPDEPDKNEITRLRMR